MFSFALFLCLSVCLTVCVCLTLCMCLCLHMFNYQPPPSLWSTPQCHATISLHCGYNLNFSPTHTRTHTSHTHTHTHRRTLAGLQIVKRRQWGTVASCCSSFILPLKWKNTHVQRGATRRTRKKHNNNNNNNNNNKKMHNTAQHITADPQLRLVFKLLLFELNKPLINTRPLPY